MNALGYQESSWMLMTELGPELRTLKCEKILPVVIAIVFFEMSIIQIQYAYIDTDRAHTVSFTSHPMSPSCIIPIFPFRPSRYFSFLSSTLHQRSLPAVTTKTSTDESPYAVFLFSCDGSPMHSTKGRTWAATRLKKSNSVGEQSGTKQLLSQKLDSSTRSRSLTTCSSDHGRVVANSRM